MEQVWFGNDEVEVLVVDLCEVFCCSRCDCLSTEVFEERPRYTREEVNVGGTCK
jgi:hypothetical protein